MTVELIEEAESTTTQISEYSHTASALAELRNRLQNVAYEVSTTKGLDVAKKDRAEVRGLRTALEAKRVELKAPALERSRLIDAEAKRLTAELVALEEPIDLQIKAEERRKEVEKAAREQAEREAAAAIQARIDAIRSVAILPAGLKASGVAQAIGHLEAVSITLKEYGDRAGEAAQAKVQTLERLDGLHIAALAHEQEQARLVAECEELARLRAEQDARDKAERELVAAEQKIESDRLAAARAAFEKEQAQARAEAKAREDADRARRDEEDRLAREVRAAEDQRLARERAELEAQQHAVREAEWAAANAARKAGHEAAEKAAAAERKRLDDEATAARAESARLDAERAAQAKAEHAAQMRANADLKRLHDAAPAMRDLLIESQTSIGGDWRQRRDAVLAKLSFEV